MDYIATYIAPYASLPPDVTAVLSIPKAPPVPPCLEELERCEAWGFPNPGSWMDQPTEWMDDIEAAKRGRWRGRQKQRQAVDTRSLFANAPGGEVL